MTRMQYDGAATGVKRGEWRLIRPHESLGSEYLAVLSARGMLCTGQASQRRSLAVLVGNPGFHPALRPNCWRAADEALHISINLIMHCELMSTLFSMDTGLASPNCPALSSTLNVHFNPSGNLHYRRRHQSFMENLPVAAFACTVRCRVWYPDTCGSLCFGTTAF